MPQPIPYQQALKDTFGFDSLRTGQEDVISRVLEGRSSAAIFPTGSGKSLCYQLPAILLPHLTLVISPLLALMKDQIDFLRSKNIPAASIDSSQNWEQSQQVMQGVRTGDIKILMISVERLKNERFRNFIAQVPISLLVVDEAHCISEWGHNFRPDYLKLPHYREALNIPQVLLLTATATPPVIKDMGSKFGIAEADIIITGFYRPNLDLSIIAATDEDKLSTLYQVLGTQSQPHSQPPPQQPSIVYVTLQQTAEFVAKQLNQQAYPAQAYHAGMDSERRQAIQQSFMKGEINCIVATIAFGMGIDKANIRKVVHYDLPKSIENYSQEIGRAGRDGETSHCTVIANKAGLNTLENFVYGDTPDLESIAFILDEIKNQQEQWEVMLHRLSKESNIRPLPLKTLMVYLELQNIIEPQYSYFADYRFKCNQTLQQITTNFEGERQQFIENIFASSPKARTWHTVDFDALWNNHQGERKRAVTAIDYLSEKGWIELESKQMTEVYRVVNKEYDAQEQAAKLFDLFTQKESSEIDRINKMIAFFENKKCLSHDLAYYFADHNAPTQCGHCSVCRGDITVLPSAASLPEITGETLKVWCDPFIKACKTMPSSAAITRFLNGMTSPLNTKVKARQMAGWGELEAYPFAKVRALVRKTYSFYA